MSLSRTRRYNSVGPFKYEMTKRKENWKSLIDPLEQMLMLSPEKQSSIVGELVTKACYNNLVDMLELSPSINISCEPSTNTIDTNIPYIYTPTIGVADDSDINRASNQESKLTTVSIPSDSTFSSQYEPVSVEYKDFEKSFSRQWTGQTDTQESSSKYEALSDFVEVEKKTSHKQELMIKHKAILLFLDRPGVDVATWRVKKPKNDSELNEMTLDEMGGFLINKIAVDFCEWMRKLGGDEKSLSEDILKELFQIGMDNPASRALSIQECEKRVLYNKLADFLHVPVKSFQEILSQHLKWDSKVERESSKLIAFGKGLPKDLRFKAPQNKTTEKWLEWNQLSAEELSFADVYSSIKDLRSTKEYCRWMLNHPQHKKPQYLINEGLFNKVSSDQEYSFIGYSSMRLTVDSNVSHAPTVSTAGAGHVLSSNLKELFDNNKAKFN